MDKDLVDEKNKIKDLKNDSDNKRDDSKIVKDRNKDDFEHLKK